MENKLPDQKALRTNDKRACVSSHSRGVAVRLPWQRARALASYAKQAKDEQLRKHADCIQAHAIRRCGELLKQIPAANGARN